MYLYHALKNRSKWKSSRMSTWILVLKSSRDSWITVSCQRPSNKISFLRNFWIKVTKKSLRNLARNSWVNRRKSNRLTSSQPCMRNLKGKLWRYQILKEPRKPLIPKSSSHQFFEFITILRIDFIKTSSVWRTISNKLLTPCLIFVKMLEFYNKWNKDWSLSLRFQLQSSKGFTNLFSNSLASGFKILKSKRLLSKSYKMCLATVLRNLIPSNKDSITQRNLWATHKN
jgi:hypothetical protein